MLIFLQIFALLSLRPAPCYENYSTITIIFICVSVHHLILNVLIDPHSTSILLLMAIKWQFFSVIFLSMFIYYLIFLNLSDSRARFPASFPFIKRKFHYYIYLLIIKMFPWFSMTLCKYYRSFRIAYWKKKTGFDAIIFQKNFEFLSKQEYCIDGNKWLSDESKSGVYARAEDNASWLWGDQSVV